MTVHRGSWLHSQSQGRVTLGLELAIFTRGQVAQLEPWLSGTNGCNCDSSLGWLWCRLQRHDKGLLTQTQAGPSSVCYY